jgi:hypothetical protein
MKVIIIIDLDLKKNEPFFYVKHNTLIVYFLLFL